MGHICKEQNPPKFLVIFLYIRIPERVEMLTGAASASHIHIKSNFSILFFILVRICFKECCCFFERQLLKREGNKANLNYQSRWQFNSCTSPLPWAKFRAVIIKLSKCWSNGRLHLNRTGSCNEMVKLTSNFLIYGQWSTRIK